MSHSQEDELEMILDIKWGKFKVHSYGDKPTEVWRKIPEDVKAKLRAKLQARERRAYKNGYSAGWERGKRRVARDLPGRTPADIRRAQEKWAWEYKAALTKEEG